MLGGLYKMFHILICPLLSSLSSFGADVSLSDDSGKTALQHAQEKPTMGHREIVTILENSDNYRDVCSLKNFAVCIFSINVLFFFQGGPDEGDDAGTEDSQPAPPPAGSQPGAMMVIEAAGSEPRQSLPPSRGISQEGTPDPQLAPLFDVSSGSWWEVFRRRHS